DKVEVQINGNQISVKGPQGALSRELSGVVDVALDGGQIVVSRRDESRESRAHQGLVRSLIANMVEGVANGFKRNLEINGVGFRAEQRGSFIRFDLGYSHPILFELPEGVKATIERQ